MQSDANRLLAFFRNNPNREINAYVEIVGVDGLRILEYTGRTADARKMIDCHCAKTDPLPCRAKEHIINTRKGYYKYITGEIERVRPAPMDRNEFVELAENVQEHIREENPEYRFKKDLVGIVFMKASIDELQEKLNELRKKWTKYPNRREVIELSARKIKEMIEENQKTESLVKNVHDSLM